MPPDLATQLHTALRDLTLPLPSLTWLRTLVPTRNPPPPLAPLMATARARLLAADLTTPGLLDATWASENILPIRMLNNPELDQGHLPHDIILQVVDIENISRSRWEQVEELEAIARGEQTRGREVIRLPMGGEGGDSDDDDDGNAGARGGGLGGENDGEASRKPATHKLVLQDCRGQRVCALESSKVQRVGVGTTNIGEKMILRKDTRIARGVLLLEADKCALLGGRVEEWHKQWVGERLERLKAAVGAQGQGR